MWNNTHAFFDLPTLHSQLHLLNPKASKTTLDIPSGFFSSSSGGNGGVKTEGDDKKAAAARVMRDAPAIDGAFTVPPIGPPYKRVWRLADELAQVMLAACFPS